MKNIGTVLGNILGALLALALTAAIGFYGYSFAKHFTALFSRLGFPVAMVTATATVAFLLGALLIAGSIRRASAQNREARLRPDKAEAYKLFISFWEEMLRPGQTAEAAVQLSRQMQDVNHLLLLHGCTAVIKAHAAMQMLNLQDARTQFADALLAIRKDLRVESQDLKAKDLAQLSMNDFDKTFSSSRSSAHKDTQPRVSLAPN